jgi:hypothetical protein
MNKELKKIIENECFDLGLNTSHDYDGIEDESDLIIYTKAIIKKYKQLINKPVETTNEQPKCLACNQILNPTLRFCVECGYDQED